MEAAENELNRVEAIFSRALMVSLHLDIWNYYLDYIRRTHPLSTGGSSARTVISQAYEFVLQHVGIDLESGSIWADYLIFLKTASATSSWEEQQRNDQLRKVYQRAVIIPLNNVEFLWREYNAFENGINKQTVSRDGAYVALLISQARKFLNEKSSAYMTARVTAKELTSVLGTIRSSHFPINSAHSPSDVIALSKWRRWISLEKSDPLELEDQTQSRNRVKYAYKQCLMFCRFCPEMWYDAAAYYEAISEMENVQEATHTKPSATLKEGLAANPKSWLLSFAYAEVEETAQRYENVKNTFDTLIAHNEVEITAVEAKFDELIEAAKVKESEDAPKLKLNATGTDSSDDDESDASDEAPETRQITKELAANIQGLEAERKSQINELQEEGTVAAIMYMRALRRMEGIKAARLSFANSIRSSRMSWQIYVASALMEHQYDDSRMNDKDGKAGVPIPVRIFTRGLKLFPDSIDYILEYLNFLLSIRDDKNARALFEQTIAKMDFLKARPLFTRWYEYESMYGDLTSAQKLANRIAESGSKTTNAISLFGQRFSYLGCDPIARRDLGMQKQSRFNMPPPPPMPSQMLPPHPLAFPAIPGQDIPAGAGFNPPILPQFQRNASPLPPPQVAVAAPPPPRPISTSILNLMRDLPPSSLMSGIISFNEREFVEVVAGLDMNLVGPRYQRAQAAIASRQETPPAPAAQVSVVPAKRTAQSLIPTPDDVVALGRHNDPRDPYKKRG